MTWLALGLALFFAINIGASGTAAAMASPFGGGVISRRGAVWAVAVFAFLGAILSGGPVMKTMGEGLVSPDKMSLAVAVVIVGAATFTLSVANYLRIPLSTSEVTVGAVVGAGLVLGGLNFVTLRKIVLAWCLVPLSAFVLSYLITRFIYPIILSLLAVVQSQSAVRLSTSLLLIGGGCYEAFAAGANNTANAFGPIVGAGLMSSETGSVLGGLFLGLGSILLGSRILETNARKITRFNALQGVIISVTSGTLVLLASLWGIPVPLTQATTVAIIGVGYAERRNSAMNHKTVRQIIRVWVTSPLISMLIAGTVLLMFPHLLKPDAGHLGLVRPSIDQTVEATEVHGSP